MADLGSHISTLMSFRSDADKVSYVLQNFTGIRKAQATARDPNKRGGGKQEWAGLAVLKGKDIDRVATHLTRTYWGGRKATAQCFRMAESIVNLLAIQGITYREKFDLGRVLLSAMTLAGLYSLERDDDASNSPYYLIGEDGQKFPDVEPKNTQHEPFPKWTKNFDEFGNRLVKPSYPCPADLEYEPEFPKRVVPWLEAVHHLENIPFRINTELLNWVIETDKRASTRIILKEPKDYKKRRKALDVQYKKIKRLENKFDKKKKNKGLNKSELELWNGWWNEHFRIEKSLARVQSRRSRFERELDWAKDLAKDGRPFYQRVTVDYRGRMYLPDFSYQGSDFCRAVIEFEYWGVITGLGLRQLLRHSANMHGSTASFLEKIDVEKVEQDHVAIGFDPIKHWKTVKKAKKPFGFLRSCMEMRDHLSTLKLPSEEKKQFSKAELEKIKKHRNQLDLYKLEGQTYKGQDVFETVGNKHFKSHLPIAADQSNSAFQHIAMMMDDDDLLKEVMETDVYMEVAQLSELPPDNARDLVKVIMMPWSYGATAYSCMDKLIEWRRENAGDIPFLDDMSYPEMRQMVDRVYALLQTKYRTCVRYQNRVKDIVQEAKEADEHSAIEWRTPFDFVVHHRVHKAISVERDVCAGFGKEKDDVEISALIPTSELNWRKMKTKAPPNLVHSYDASLIHGTLWTLYQSFTSGELKQTLKDGTTAVDRTAIPPVLARSKASETVDPKMASVDVYQTQEGELVAMYFNAVTVHDSFSTLAPDAMPILELLTINLDKIYAGFDPLRRFEKSVTGRNLGVRTKPLKLEGSYPFT